MLYGAPHVTRSFLRPSRGGTDIVEIHEVWFAEGVAPITSAADSGSSTDTPLSGEDFWLTLGRSESLEHRSVRYMNIGPGSPLMAHHGSISLLKNISSGNSGRLILNDVDAYRFNSSCDPESVYRIPYTYHIGVGGHGFVNVTYELIPREADNDELNPENLFTVSQRATELHFMLGIVHLPTFLADEIFGALTATRTVQTGGSSFLRILDCDVESLIAQLPLIKLSFSSNGGHFPLYPDDYILFDEELRSCALLVGTVGPDIPSLGFNPLWIQNVNIHIERDHMRLCDSSFE